MKFSGSGNPGGSKGTPIESLVLHDVNESGQAVVKNTTVMIELRDVVKDLVHETRLLMKENREMKLEMQSLRNEAVKLRLAIVNENENRS